jgi:hypothetical protein
MSGAFNGAKASEASTLWQRSALYTKIAAKASEQSARRLGEVSMRGPPPFEKPVVNKLSQTLNLLRGQDKPVQIITK